MEFDYTSVSDAGLRSLAGLPELRRLSLDSANISDSSAETIAEWKKLEFLNLYHTLVTSEGYQVIREALPDCEIIWDPLSSDPKRRGA